MKNGELWEQTKRLAKFQYEEENGIGSWINADKYEREDYIWSAYNQLVEEENKNMTRDSKGRFCKVTETTNNETNKNNKYEKENGTMTNTNKTNNGANVTRKNNKEVRMEILANAGVDTGKFFNLSLNNIPHGTPVQINIGGIMYDLTPSVVESNNEKWDHFDEVVKDILDNGFVFNRRTDGRFVVAQTFKMLNEGSYNRKTWKLEYGWDNYLRNNFGYMYQFEMMRDELKRLARMEKDNDPEFARLSRFFTKEVVVDTCEHYMKQLKKHVNNLIYDANGKMRKLKKHGRKPYIRFNEIKGQDYRGNVHVEDIDRIVYAPLNESLMDLKGCTRYDNLYFWLCDFMKHMPELEYSTPKCGVWHDAFKAKGAYMSLLNIVKFSGVKVHGMNVYESIDYIESLTEELKVKGELWKLHTLLKEVIKENDFDLKKVIESNKERG